MSVGISRYIREPERKPDPFSGPCFQDGESWRVVTVGLGWRLRGADSGIVGALRAQSTAEEWMECMFVSGLERFARDWKSHWHCSGRCGCAL